MRKITQLNALTIAGLVVGTALGAFLAMKPSDLTDGGHVVHDASVAKGTKVPEEHNEAQEDNGVSTVAQTESGIYISRMSQDNVKVLLAPDPFATITLRFFEKTVEGLEPKRVDSIEVVRSDEKWNCSYWVGGGIGLTLGAGTTQSSREMVMGRTYYLAGMKGSRFRVPQMEKGEGRVFEIILRSSKEEAEPEAELADIEGAVTGLTSYEGVGILYAAAGKVRDIPVSGAGLFQLRGVPLGGVLVVVKGREAPPLYMIARVDDVQDAALEFPRDAEELIDEASLITFDIIDVEFPDNEGALLPCGLFDENGILPVSVAISRKLTFKARKGQYSLWLLGRDFSKKQCLGKVDVVEGRREYTPVR